MAAKEFRNDPRRARLEAASKPAVVQPVKPVATATKVEIKTDKK
jgi:hypothetical protein